MKCDWTVKARDLDGTVRQLGTGLDETSAIAMRDQAMTDPFVQGAWMVRERAEVPSA